MFAEGFYRPRDVGAGGRVGTHPLATGTGALGPACQGSAGAGGAQPQRRALLPALSCPRSLHVAERPPVRLDPRASHTPAPFPLEGPWGRGTRGCGSNRRRDGGRSPGAMREGMELGASSSCRSSAKSLSNCRTAPPGGPVCQVIRAPAHVCTHEHACTSAGTRGSAGARPRGHMRTHTRAHTASADPTAPALAAPASHMTRRFGSPRSSQTKPGGYRNRGRACPAGPGCSRREPSRRSGERGRMPRPRVPIARARWLSGPGG